MNSKLSFEIKKKKSFLARLNREFWLLSAIPVMQSSHNSSITQKIKLVYCCSATLQWCQAIKNHQNQAIYLSEAKLTQNCLHPFHLNESVIVRARLGTLACWQY